MRLRASQPVCIVNKVSESSIALIYLASNTLYLVSSPLVAISANGSPILISQMNKYKPTCRLTALCGKFSPANF